jgi:hypothetical protein
MFSIPPHKNQKAPAGQVRNGTPVVSPDPHPKRPRRLKKLHSEPKNGAAVGPVKEYVTPNGARHRTTQGEPW